ncbi:MAG: alpha/beta fold hydrolase [Ilumatobacter sp.]
MPESIDRSARVTPSNSGAVDIRADAPPPWLPPGEIVLVPGRGEFFVRRHVHPDPGAPTVLLLHGWTASADLQFLAAYRALAATCSFVGIDHRGHGRGFRSTETFELHDVADDAAGVIEQLDIDRVIALGYSMGGPISMLLARRHPGVVAGLVVQATALEWRASLRERLSWRLLPLLGVGLRSWTQPRVLRRGIEFLIADDGELAAHRPWLVAEAMRNEPRVMVQAGKALSAYDARPWVSDLDVPAAMLISTKDRLVKPRKQRQLAAALDAAVVAVPMDHLGSLAMPAQFASATVELVSSVAAALSSGSDGSIAEASDST